MKDENPIEEIWRIRDELSAEYGYDVHRIFAALREEEKQHGDRLVQPPVRSVPSKPALTLREGSPPYGGKARGTKR
ncbi:MAG: hypothetical protein NT154_46495 [Verrucomicrobia bacterium]|nr:hypothetical protein [Verrucomicrobiota bacterium]